MVVNTGMRIFNYQVSPDIDAKSVASTSGATIHQIYRSMVANRLTKDALLSEIEDALGFIPHHSAMFGLENARNFKEFERALTRSRENLSAAAGNKHAMADSAQAIMENNNGEPEKQEQNVECSRKKSDIAGTTDFLRPKDPEKAKPVRTNRVSGLNPLTSKPKTADTRSESVSRLHTACRMFLDGEFKAKDFLAFFMHVLEEENISSKHEEIIKDKLGKLVKKHELKFQTLASLVTEAAQCISASAPITPQATSAKQTACREDFEIALAHDLTYGSRTPGSSPDFCHALEQHDLGKVDTLLSHHT